MSVVAVGGCGEDLLPSGRLAEGGVLCGIAARFCTGAGGDAALPTGATDVPCGVPAAGGDAAAAGEPAGATVVDRNGALCAGTCGCGEVAAGPDLPGTWGNGGPDGAPGSCLLDGNPLGALVVAADAGADKPAGGALPDGNLLAGWAVAGLDVPGAETGRPPLG